MTTILEDATAATAQRGEHYGHPIDHFRRTALLWTAHLQARGLMALDKRLEWWDCPTMQEEDKISRNMTNPRHRDSLTDRCGYPRTIEMGWNELDRRNREKGNGHDHVAKELPCIPNAGM